MSFDNGTLNFINITGGSGGTHNYGVFVNQGNTAALVASSIIALDCMGGTGTGSDIGFYVTDGSN